MVHPGTDSLAAGGLVLGKEEYATALKAVGQLSVKTELPSIVSDWMRITPREREGHLSTISEGRGILGNIGHGTQNALGSTVSGLGRGPELVGSEGADGAPVNFGKGLSPNEHEQARSCLMRNRTASSRGRRISQR